jgi:peroxiredoxin
LLAFQVQAELFKKLDIRVVAASVDPLDKATNTVQALKLTFPVGYGLNAMKVSKQIGAYYEPKDLYLHATGFLLNPDGKVLNAVYSSRSIGRLEPHDVASLVEVIRSKENK